jgi:hypothetical protein
VNNDLSWASMELVHTGLAFCDVEIVLGVGEHTNVDF